MYRFINDRSNLDEVIAKGKDGNITRRQQLENGGMPRSDVVLLTGTRSGQQHALYVRMEGYAGDTWILDFLTDEEYDQVEEIADRMRQNARDFGPAWKLLS